MSEKLSDETQDEGDGKKNKAEILTQDRTEEERVYQALERARQTVKPIVKRLLEAETVDDELLHLRLKDK